MIQLEGKYNKDCKILIDEIDENTLSQIMDILNQPVSEGVPVRIMPDTHFGSGICIGFTMPLTNMVNPQHLGVDLGCGMLNAKFDGTTKMDLEKIDKAIRKAVPMGFETHKSTQFKNIPFDKVQMTIDRFAVKFNKKFGTDYQTPTYNEKWLSEKLKTINIDETKFWFSIGTLGGGNHYIEIGKDNSNNYWVSVHSGSRNFGLKIADYWTNVAKGKVIVASQEYNIERDNIIANTVPKNYIPKKLQELKAKYGLGINKEYLTGVDMFNYLTDAIFAKLYAEWNRETMLEAIKNVLGVKNFTDVISTVHNYVSDNDMIIRKGAISCNKDEVVVIPLNMRDGTIIAKGKGNSDWNNSGPHGAGRIMSRTEAKGKVDLKDFQKTMKDVYSTSVCKATLDESPFAYKSSDMIKNSITDTAEIIDIIKPVLNIKDASNSMSWKERKAKKRADEQRKKERKEKSFRKMKRY